VSSSRLSCHGISFWAQVKYFLVLLADLKFLFDIIKIIYHRVISLWIQSFTDTHVMLLHKEEEIPTAYVTTECHLHLVRETWACCLYGYSLEQSRTRPESEFLDMKTLISSASCQIRVHRDDDQALYHSAPAAATDTRRLYRPTFIHITLYNVHLSVSSSFSALTYEHGVLISCPYNKRRPNR